MIINNNNKEVFLVTTPLEDTWPKNSPIVFLGDWCLIFNKKTHWKDLDYKIANYHWDDRKKLRRDYYYLRNLHEELLAQLTIKLNKLHGVSYSSRYWRIYIGPWLMSFVQILFDRWTMINQVFSQFQIDKCIVLERDFEVLIPKNMEDFGNKTNTDDWNEAIYAELLRVFFSDKVDIENINKINQDNLAKDNSSINIKHRLKKVISRVVFGMSSRIYSNSEFFFIETLLSRKFELSLHMKIGQFPKIWQHNDNSKTEIKVKPMMRNLVFDFKDKNDDFCNVLAYMIPRHIPKMYVESYKFSLKNLKKLPWPKKPKAIITGNVFKNDNIKLWIAEKVENRVPLFVRQHGGAYGVCEFSSIEDHEQSIADIWLSWGWASSEKQHVIPASHFKYKKNEINYNPNGNALMVEFSMQRYSYSVVSYPIAGQWSYYFNDQVRFLAALPSPLREKVLIRIRSYDYDQYQEERWKELFPNILVDKGFNKLQNLIEQSRLYISTYNATTFLESLNWNIPTIIFWDPKYNELNKRAKNDFELLKSVGIFHETPEQAANQMIKVWDNVSAWWDNEELQKVRENFCNDYIRSYDKPINEFKNLLIEHY